MNTELASTQIAQLTAIMTGGGYKRSATKADAIKRFVKVATENGLGTTTIEAILACPSDAAENVLRGALSTDDAEKEALLRDCGQDDGEAGASYADLSEEPAAISPGLARLRTSKNAEAIRLSTIEEGKTALAKVKAARANAAAKAADAAAKAPKVAKAPKTQKAPKEKKASDATRTRIDGAAKIAVVAEKNPKKQGSRSYARFALYANGQTVEQFIAACVAAGFPANEAKADLSWDRRHGFIAVA